MRDDVPDVGRSGRSARRRRHHLLIGAAALALGALFVAAYDRERLWERLSFATGHLGLLLLAGSLLLGPLNVLRRRANPVSTDLRRDVGIWAGVLALVHVVLGLGVHMSGRTLEYFLRPAGERGIMPLRFDPFGLTNDLGLLAGVILLGLLMISSDAALKRLGRARWKRWQRASYIAAAATVVHGALYQFIESRVLPFVIVLAVATVIAVAAQSLGFRAVRGGAGRASR